MKEISWNQYKMTRFSFMGQNTNIICMIYHLLVRSSKTNKINKISNWFCIANLKWCLGNSGSKSIWVPYIDLVLKHQIMFAPLFFWRQLFKLKLFSQRAHKILSSWKHNSFKRWVFNSNMERPLTITVWSHWAYTDTVRGLAVRPQSCIGLYHKCSFFILTSLKKVCFVIAISFGKDCLVKHST